VCDLSTSPVVDLAGGRMLLALAGECASRGVTLRVVEARAAVRDLLRGVGIEDRIGPISRRVSMAAVIAEGSRHDG
jgi:hypothetical protein